MTITLQRVAAAFDPGYLQLILLPTEGCNFRCTYCYEDFKLGRMDRAVVDGIKALIRNRAADLHTLEIGWFGGEPLIAKDIVCDISEYILDITRRYSGLAYKAGMTTNGYLLDCALARRLDSLGVRDYQISLDGEGEVHDRTRVHANGRGTFDRIWANLLALRDSNLELSVLLRVHFSPDSYPYIHQLVASINREFGGDPRFSVLFKAVERLGGLNDASIRVFSSANKVRLKQELQGELAYRGQIDVLSSSDEPYICYASKPNSLVVRSDGTIGKCTVALYDERNRIGRLNPDGTLQVDQGKFRTWIRGFGSMDEEDLACPYATLSS